MNEKVREFIERYAVHDDTCAGPHPDKCSCGFEKAMQEIERSPEPGGECKDCDQLMTERDRAEAYADQLADCIEAITGIENGEHSSGNFPWENAIEAAQYGILRMQELQAIAEVASRVHIAMAADSASDEGHDEGPGAEDHSEYLIMEAEDQLQAALKPWRERRSTPTKAGDE